MKNMKTKNLKKLISVTLFVALGYGVSVAADICRTALTKQSGGSFNGTVYLTCRTTGSDQYEIVIETEGDVMLQTGNNMYIRPNGGLTTALQLLGNNSATGIVGGKTYTKSFTGTGPADAHGNIGLMLNTSNNWVYFNWAANINWSATCEVSVDDEEAPVMTAATAGSIAATSAVLTLTATDNINVTQFVVKDAANGVNQTFPYSAGNTYNLTGLKPETTYNLQVTAKDAAGNESTAISVTAFITDVAPPITTPSNYCERAFTSIGGTNKTIYISFQQLTYQNYQIKIESDENMESLGNGCHVTLNGSNVQMVSLPGYSVSADKKTITVNMTATTAPVPYQPIYVNMPTQAEFAAWPTDIVWGVCPVVEFDGPPTMEHVELVSETYNSATIEVEGLDYDGGAISNFMVAIGDKEAPKTLYQATGGKITVKNLPADATSYIFIWARDAAKQISEDPMTVEVTTPKFASDCQGERGHIGDIGNAPIIYEISYLKGTVTYTIKAKNGANLTYLQFGVTQGSVSGSIEDGVGIYTQTGVAEGTMLGIQLVYSYTGISGNRQTSNAVSLTDPNIILYEVGHCPYVDETPPVMGSAFMIDDASDTEAVIIVGATDDITEKVTKFIVSINGGEEEEYIAVNDEILLEGLTPETDYSVEIWAVDEAGNISENSEIVTFTTAVASDATPPEMLSASLEGAAGETSAVILVSASDNETDPVTLFIVVINGEDETTQYVAVDGKITLHNLSPASDYSVEIWAKDEAGNVSENSKIVTFKTAATPDVTLPVMVSAELDGLAGETSATILVSASDNETDPVTLFIVAINGEEETTQYVAVDGKITLNDLSPASDYSVEIWAKDEAGNVSENSEIVTFTTANVVSVKLTDADMLKIYPVVVVDNVNITSQNIILKTTVYDMPGQTVFSKNSKQHSISINLSALSSGLYTILIETDNGQFLRKIIKK